MGRALALYVGDGRDAKLATAKFSTADLKKAFPNGEDGVWLVVQGG